MLFFSFGKFVKNLACSVRMIKIHKITGGCHFCTSVTFARGDTFARGETFARRHFCTSFTFAGDDTFVRGLYFAQGDTFAHRSSNKTARFKL